MEENKQLIRQSNVLTESRYDFDPIEKRCIYTIIQKVRKDYVEGQRSLFDNMLVHLQPSALLQIVDAKHTKQAKDALNRLRKRDIEIENDKMWLICGFINWAKFEKENNVWTVEVSSQIMPYLVELAAKYTEYSLTVAISLKSKWAQRFYELCCQYKNNNNGYFGKTIDQLRQMFMLEDKYPKLPDFKTKVINKAQKELKEAYDKGQCDVWFDYFQKGKGADARFDFIIHTKESDIKQTELWENMKTQTIYIVKVLQLTYKTDPKFVKRVTNELQINPDLLHPMFDKITKLQKDFKGGEFAKLLRWVIKEDFKIQ